WAMVERGWQVHVRGEGRRFASARQAIETLREEGGGTTDQFLPSFVIADDAGPVGPIRDGASVVLFNFRGDRAIEISRAFEDGADFPGFDRGPVPKVRYAGMMQYDGDLKLPSRFLVAPPKIERTLGEHLARNGISQFACSETQKFGHVTYFWNGNRSGKFDERETYLEIPSDLVPFEQRPWMKAAEIADATLKALPDFRHLRINFANGDMVGHTGHLQAAIQAVEAVDLQLDRLLRAVKAHRGVALITADHGNADEMFMRDKKGAFEGDGVGGFKPRTSHSLNPVPLCLYDPHGFAPRLADTVPRPGLANLAGTVFELLGHQVPDGFQASLLGKA
ncbi:MAG: 2,3-bisphosphoglycerate-independent phosphoglycerate mutase, partial [Myxococcales bacterium]|nr:2,3-bisphosphoglycerate-independent phosphoglycerate mutase [Myxococcales bacterium]